MALQSSTMLALGTTAPDFSLPDSAGKPYALSHFSDAPALLVIFMCNHCPYVKHLRSGLAQLASEYQDKGVAVVGINANDLNTHPADNAKNMAIEIADAGYTFPYLIDETQAVAKAYRAACTPDFFLFDEKQQLVYRGQMDDSRPENGKPVTGSDLRAALNAVLYGESVSEDQTASIGCNIKWKAGNEPSYYTG